MFLRQEAALAMIAVLYHTAQRKWQNDNVMLCVFGFHGVWLGIERQASYFVKNS
jgi:hypothetical protein